VGAADLGSIHFSKNDADQPANVLVALNKNDADQPANVLVALNKNDADQPANVLVALNKKEPGADELSRVFLANEVRRLLNDKVKKAA
jgi:hypothetical protein